MTNRNYNDEMLLMDFLLGRRDSAEAEAIRLRLQRDREFQEHHDDLARLYSALDLLGQEEPPENLVENTLARIALKRRTDALLAREGMTRPQTRPMFSLRETAAVAVAFIMLACVLVPSFRQASRLAGVGACASNQGQIGAAMVMYAMSNDEYLPPARTGSIQWLRRDKDKPASNSEGLFRLISGKYADQGIFQCSSATKKPGVSFAVSAGMTDFPTDDSVSYSYQHTLGGAIRRTDKRLTKVADTMAILADRTPMFQRGRFRRDRLRTPVSDNHDRTGQNVLYLDGHVAWSKTATAGVMGNNIYLAEGIYEYRGDEKPASPTDTFLLPAYSLPQ